MGIFNKKTSVEQIIENQEQRFVIEVGHNRNNELIIKKVRVSGDNLTQVMDDLGEALLQYNSLRDIA